MQEILLNCLNPCGKTKNIFTITEKHRHISLQSLCTFMSTTPGKDPIRCSMDWTQEPQVIPSTPRETEHRLPFCAMTASSRKTKQNRNDRTHLLLAHCTAFLLKQNGYYGKVWGNRDLVNTEKKTRFITKHLLLNRHIRHIWWSRLKHQSI